MSCYGSTGNVKTHEEVANDLQAVADERIVRCPCCGCQESFTKYAGLARQTMIEFKGRLIFCTRCGQVYIRTEIGTGFSPCLSALSV